MGCASSSDPASDDEGRRGTLAATRPTGAPGGPSAASASATTRSDDHREPTTTTTTPTTPAPVADSGAIIDFTMALCPTPGGGGPVDEGGPSTVAASAPRSVSLVTLGVPRRRGEGYHDLQTDCAASVVAVVDDDDDTQNVEASAVMLQDAIGPRRSSSLPSHSPPPLVGSSATSPLLRRSASVLRYNPQSSSSFSLAQCALGSPRGAASPTPAGGGDASISANGTMVHGAPPA